MKTVFLILFFLVLAHGAIRQVRQDARFTAKVIWVHIAALLLYFGLTAAVISGIIYFLTLPSVSGFATLGLIAMMLAWIALSTVLLGRFLSRVLKKAEHTHGERLF